jgi:predicted TIM-barrel fold metal-dependent hydrolase
MSEQLVRQLPRLRYSNGIDADGHVLEPPDLWERYLEPRYRDRALRVRKDPDDGLEYLEIDGRPSKLLRRGMMSGLGLMDRVGGIVHEREPTGSGYVDMAPLGAMNAAERIERLDLENLDRVLLYPTLSAMWLAECEDEELTQAYLRAYNRFIVDFCSDSEGRLVPIASISLGDPEAAEREVVAMAEAGVAGIWVPTFSHTRLPTAHPDHHRVFAAAAEAGLPVGIHPCLEPKWTAPGRYGEMTSSRYAFFLNVTAGDSVRHAFTSFFQYGVLEKLPDLKLVVLECGASWIGYWLDRMDTTWHSPQGILAREVMPEKPSHYFRRQCWISADPDETTLPGVIEVVGEDRFFWASDFPHPDHPPEYIPNIEARVAEMQEEPRNKLLGDNVRRAYGLR